MPPLLRIKRLLFSPVTAWSEINEEQISIPALYFSFVVPLLLLGSISLFFGYGFVGYDSFILKIKGFNWGLWFGLRHLITGTAVFFISFIVINLLAPVLSSNTDLIKSAQLVAYSATPSWLAAIFYIIPSFGFLGVLGLYGIYLFYTGLPILKKTPEQKRIIYMLVSSLIIIILSWIMQVVVGAVLNQFIGDPYAGTAEDLRNVFQQK